MRSTWLDSDTWPTFRKPISVIAVSSQYQIIHSSEILPSGRPKFNSVYKFSSLITMTKCHAQVVHIATQMNMVGASLWWGPWARDPCPLNPALALPKRHATWHTQVSQPIRRSTVRNPNSLSKFSQLASSSDLAVASESLLMHSSTEAFICAKLKHLAWKTLDSSARWGGNVDKRKAPCWNFCFHKSR